MEKLNILIVDDCPVMRFVVKRTIELCSDITGEVIQAGNGKEGLKILDSRSFDLLIVDINMPVMGGLEMIEKVRNKPGVQHIPILTVSTESNKTRIDLIQNLSTDFVHKPFSPESLRDKMLKLLKKEAIKKEVSTYKAGSDTGKLIETVASQKN